MNVRDLRVTDIRCQARGCGAGPGEPCTPGYVALAAYGFPNGGGLLAHRLRVEEHAQLVAEGWEWQEVDSTDAGAAERNRGER